MIELTTSLLMLATAFMPASGEGTTTEPINTVSTEAYVREYWKDTPIMAEVARCESTFKQFSKNGDVIRGKVNKGDIGVMQINKYYHEEDALELGFDIYTIDGNLGFARHLYNKFGTDPWKSSSACWKKHEGGSADALAKI